MHLAPQTPVVVDGIYHGQVVEPRHAGQHVVRIDAPEPFDVLAQWDGDVRSAVNGAPLMVSVEAEA